MKQFLPIVLKTDLVPLLLGHTGVGKTEGVAQYTNENEMDLIVIHVAQLEPSDFIGLYEKNEEGRTRNCPPAWLPYKQRVTELDKSKNPNQTLADVMPDVHDGTINPKGGIIFLDEVNRGHEDIRQALYQLLTAKRIHTYALPENYKIVAAANPFEDYEVYDFDRALRNRFAWVKFKPDFEETQEYLKGKFGNSPIIHWINSDKTMLEYGDDFKVDDMVLSPRIEENAIKIYEEVKNERKDFMRKCLETIIQPEKVQSFLSFLEELKNINYKEVLQGKKKEKVKQLVEDKRLDILSTVTNDLAEYFSKTKSPKKEEIKNVTDFLMATPDELNTVFLDQLKTYGEKGSIENDPYFRSNLKNKLGKYKRLF